MERHLEYSRDGNLKTFDQGGVVLHYVYSTGNRLEEIRQSSETGAVVKSFEYDANGSRLRTWQGPVATGTELQAFSYDAQNRVASVTMGGSTSVSFAYDPSDYRIRKQSASETREYHLEGEHLEAVYDDSGTLRSKFLRGVVIDEIVNGFEYDGQGDETNLNFHHDHLRSVTGLSSHDGAGIEQITYSPFGSLYNQGGVPTTDLRFTGREFDQETGLYYYRARYYDPEVRRFLSEAPLGFDASVNFYAYVGNNPLIFSDPTGLVRWSDVASSSLGMAASGAGAFVGYAMTTGGAALIGVPEPTMATKVAGVGAVGFGLMLVSKSSADFILNLQNFASALADQQPTVPSSAAELVVDVISPGSRDAQLLAVAANLTIDLASGRLPAGPILTNADSVLASYRPARFSELNNQIAHESAIGFQAIGTAIPDVATSTRAVDFLQGGATLQAGFNNFEPVIERISGSAAAGGFVLYPSTVNRNTLTRIYEK